MKGLQPFPKTERNPDGSPVPEAVLPITEQGPEFMRRSSSNPIGSRTEGVGAEMKKPSKNTPPPFTKKTAAKKATKKAAPKKGAKKVAAKKAVKGTGY